MKGVMMWGGGVGMHEDMMEGNGGEVVKEGL
jgi:hypothetical protein